MRGTITCSTASLDRASPGTGSFAGKETHEVTPSFRPGEAGRRQPASIAKDNDASRRFEPLSDGVERLRLDGFDQAVERFVDRLPVRQLFHVAEPALNVGIGRKIAAHHFTSVTMPAPK